MKTQNDHTTSPPGSLQVEIVDVLDAHGIDPETYTLYEYVDPDAVETVVSSADSSLEVRLTVEDVRLSITQDGVHSLE